MRKLIDAVAGDEVILPADLLWVDEFSWAPVEMNVEFALSGELHAQSGTKKKGRYITLEAPDDEMAWVTREVVTQLSEKANVAAREFTLVLGSAPNERQFNVAFRHNEQALDVAPVYRWQPEEGDSMFKITLRLIEV